RPSPGHLAGRACCLCAAVFHFGLELRPARKAVITSDGELGRRQSNRARDLPQPPQGTGITAEGSPVQLTGLAAELIQIRASRHLGHVASPPRAWARIPARLKTVLPSSITHLSGGGLGPSRGPGGALPRRCQPTAAAG